MFADPNVLAVERSAISDCFGIQTFTANFTRRMRVTASSIRAIGTAALVHQFLFPNVLHELLVMVGTITISIPALIEIPIAFL